MSDAPRISALPTLSRCPGAYLCDRDSGRTSSAADTGTAVGRIVELWHRLGENDLAIEEATRNAMSEGSPRTELADWDRAREWAQLYAADPRNCGVVVAEYCEIEVTLTLEADPDDPTGLPLEFVGHVDQIRRGSSGCLEVWDVKSGKPYGDEMVSDYALQLVGYALACTQTLGEPVLPGGIVRMRGYTPERGSVEPSQANVFFPTPWSHDACRDLIHTAVYTVGEFRRGIARLQPGKHCRWCPAGNPGLCGPQVAAELDRQYPPRD